MGAMRGEISGLAAMGTWRGPALLVAGWPQASCVGGRAALPCAPGLFVCWGLPPGTALHPVPAGAPRPATGPCSSCCSKAGGCGLAWSAGDGAGAGCACGEAAGGAPPALPCALPWSPQSGCCLPWCWWGDTGARGFTTVGPAGWPGMTETGGTDIPVLCPAGACLAGKEALLLLLESDAASMWAWSAPPAVSRMDIRFSTGLWGPDVTPVPPEDGAGVLLALLAGMLLPFSLLPGPLEGRPLSTSDSRMSLRL